MGTNNDIILPIVVGVVFMLMLALAVIVFVTLHRKRYLAQLVSLQKAESEKKEALLKTIIETQEVERARIAQHLHDGVNMQIVVANLAISQHLNHLERNIPSPINIDEKLQDLEGIVETIRGVCRNLYPQTFDREGLVDSLVVLFYKLNETKVIHCHCEFKIQESLLQLDRENKLAFYRICQELLNNILKHACCNELSVSLFANDHELNLHLLHNGKPFTNADAEKSMQQNSFGLLSIVNRLQKLQGSIDYISSNNQSVIQLRLKNAYAG